MERYVRDYGLDLQLKTFGPGGTAERDHLDLQVKATDRLAVLADGMTAALRVDAADLRLWAIGQVPVILVLYDATADRAFWLDVQTYIASQQIEEDDLGETVTLRVPLGQTLSPGAVTGFRALRSAGGPRPRRSS